MSADPSAVAARPATLPAASGRWRLVLGLATALYVASAAWHIFYGAPNTDEGFYAVATRAVAQGEMPYRDFGFTQPPLVLYVNSLPLRLLGFGLFAQRFVNGLSGALALALAAGWLIRRTRLAWGAALVGGFALAAPWMYFIHLGKTYGLTALLLMAAARAFLDLPAGPRRNFLLGLLAALGVGTRLPAAPFFGVLWLLALWPGRRPTAAEALAAAGGASVLGLIALPFWLAAPEAARFWVFDFHQISVPYKTWHLAWQEIATLAPAAWLLAGLAVVCAVGRRRFTRETGVLLAAGAGLAANLLPGGVYEEYGVPFLLPLAAAAAALVHDECRHRRSWVAPALGGVLLAAQLLTAPLLYFNTLPARRGTPSAWLPYNAPPYNLALPAQLAAARRITQQSLAAGAPFVGSNLILATEAGRAVPAELRMGAFALTLELPPARAALLHLATRAQLDAWLARPDVTLVAYYPNWTLNYGWSMPSFAATPEPVLHSWLAIFQRDFFVAWQEGGFLLLVRKGTAIPASR